MKTGRTFGVEIEINGTLYKSTRKHRVLQNVYPRSLRYTSLDMYPTNYFEIELEPGWKFVVDTTCGIEFVSPPLCDTIFVRRMVDAIKATPLEHKFSTSGLHVHVGAPDFRKPDLINVVKFCRHFDRAIFSFTEKDRIKDTHCKPVRQDNAQIAGAVSGKKIVYNRYTGCNIAAYDKHGTIEFRYAKSTLQFGKIEAFIDLFICVADFVIQNKDKKIKSPRRLVDKRKFLLDLIGVRQQTKYILLHA